MNREIRFRGLTINTKRWVYGYLAEIETNWDYYNGYGLPTEYSKVIISTEYTTREAVDIIPETVGQYTGLKDKNGKEIYEGDILEFTWEEDSCWGNEGTYKGYVQHNDGGYEVVYINRQECTPTKDGGIHPNSKSDDLQSFIRWTNEINIEVIGNIYQDSELLEVSNGQH